MTAPEMRAEPAEHRTGEQRDRRGESPGLGRGDACDEHEHRAADRAVGRADRERPTFQPAGHTPLTAAPTSLSRSAINDRPGRLFIMFEARMKTIAPTAAQHEELPALVRERTGRPVRRLPQDVVSGLAVRAAGDALERLELRQHREDRRQRQSDEREVEPADAQRGNADEEPDRRTRAPRRRAGS